MDNWIDTVHCTSKVHCDFCLASAVWHNAQAERFAMPAFGTCPYGETVAAGKARRMDVFAERIADGRLSLEKALAMATALGMNLDGEPDEPTREI